MEMKNENIPTLPRAAIELVPQRPPMLIVDRLISRDLGVNFSEVEALAPVEGIFIDEGNCLLPEYFIELVAQSMAAVNGYDGLVDGGEVGRGFLVGIEDFSWQGTAEPGEFLRIEMEKTFEFGPVTVMAGRVLNGSGDLLATGELKVWEEK